ncbi:MAG: lysophospholipid acyltransferase family protein [Gracilimonas sp.]|nr:lysophospholipid acyltransferase family protein [Gracilimonas sp.]
MNFIPADESRFYTWFFERYTEWALKRRFKQIWVKQQYVPSSTSKTVYFLNHNLWWDGLIPLYLNRHFFKQNARALMEDKQMWQYSFFSKIGAFSIDLEDTRSTIRSLRYAVQSMDRDHSCLFIYPEGSIKPASGQKPVFKKGLAWLYQNVNKEVDFVPVAIYAHFIRSSKPELHLSIGPSCEHDNSLSKNDLNDLLENDLHSVLKDLRKKAGFQDNEFEPQF